jgi:acetyl-CoA C-acetyltransferase
MPKVVIVSAARTAIGNFGGTLQSVTAVELGAIVIKEVISRASLEPVDIDEVIMGNVLQAGLGQNPARQSAIRAGIPVEKSALTVNKVCGSGLQAVVLAAQAIKSGDADIIVAGGMENMSLAPFLLDKARFGYKLGNGNLIDSLVYDGLTDVYSNKHMGFTVEDLATKYEITREAQDQYAVNSQAKCARAINEGWFRNEIVPVSIPQRKGDQILFDTDEFPRSDTNIEALGRLKPAFRPDGTVTPGNASGINDGAAAVVVMSEEKAAEMGIKPLAEIVSYATAGVDPGYMGIGPVGASRKALDKAGLSIDDIDLIELNEAFASQSIAVNKEMGWDESKVNIGGGAIALGHPIGASGTRVLVTLLYAMDRTTSAYGLSTLCIGGGEGIAMVVKRY